jgi:hypothetical protein
MSELTPVHGTDNKHRIADVVFVHGLGGDAVAYWQSQADQQTFWPAWLAREDGFDKIGIWSLAYDAAPFAWKGEAMPLFANANNALERLTLQDIGVRPLVFVTHSLGGLLVKKMMQSALGLKILAWHTLAHNTRGVVFIATPHTGASLANFVGYIGWLLGASVSVSDLRASSAALMELNTWYRQNVGFDAEGDLPIRSIVYYEESRTRWKWFRPLGVIVVDRASADPGIKGVVPIGIARDHRTIHKPRQRSDQVYLGVLRHIQECLLPGF